MQESGRFGRSLDEVFHCFLSEDVKREVKNANFYADNTHVIHCLHPGSILIQSFLITNLAFELARYQLSVIILEHMDYQEGDVLSIAKSLIPDHNAFHGFSVKINGCANITLVDSASGKDFRRHVSGWFEVLINPERFLLINSENILENFPNQQVPSDIILMTRTDRKSLLQAYAYIKYMLEYDTTGRIYIVFDEIQDEEKAQKIFTHFAQYIDRKLCQTPIFLGPLVHDELLYRSIKVQEPLVLSQEDSISKQCLMSICDKFIMSEQMETG